MRMLSSLLLAGAALALAASSVAQRVAGSVGPIESSFFGMHMHYAVRPNDFNRVSAWPAVPFGAWRLHDAYVQWRNLEPQPGQWDFRTLDRYADLAQRHGVSLLYTLGHPAQWASARPNEPTYTYGPGVAAEPARLADWENYVRTVVSRYRGRIHAYEIWNEPSFSEIENVLNKDGKAAFYSGSAEKMIELARVAYRVVKEIDPAARVLTPAFHHPEIGPKRLDLYLKLGGAAVSDAVAFHFYSLAPESMLPTIREVQAIMQKHGIGQREIWNTESGYVTQNRDEPGVWKKSVAPGRKALDEPDAAAYVTRTLVLAAAGGVKRFYWYAWDNGIYGLTHGRGRIPHEAARAYATTVRWLLGATVSDCETPDREQWVCTLKRAERTAWIVWRTRGEGEWAPPTRALQLELVDGTLREPSASGMITIGSTPVLVKADGSSWGP